MWNKVNCTKHKPCLTLTENRKSTTRLSDEGSDFEVRSVAPRSAKKCGITTLDGTPCRRRVLVDTSPSRCYMHKE